MPNLFENFPVLNDLSKFGEKLAKWFGEKTSFGIVKNSPETHKINEFFDRYPLSTLLPYENYDPETNLFINKNSIGFILEASTLTGANEEIVNILTSIVTDVLPDDTDIQFLLWASDKIGETLDSFEEVRSRVQLPSSGDDGIEKIFGWLAKKRTDYFKSGTLESLASNGSFILRDFSVFIAVSLPKKGNEDLTSELLGIRENIVSSLKSINIFSENIAIERFLSVMIDLLNPNSNVYPAKQSWNEFDSLSLQITDPEYCVRVFSNHLVLSNDQENFDVRCFSVKDFPTKMAQWKMTDSIGQMFNTSLQIPSPFLVSLHIHTLEHEKAAAKVQLKFMNQDSKARSPLYKFKPSLGKESMDWAFVRERLAEGDRLVKVNYQVVMYAKEEDANASERKIRDLYRANSWKLRKESFLQFQSFLAMLPMMMTEGMYKDFKSFGRLRTMTAFNAINIAPLQGEWKGTRTPSMILPGRRGQIATWNPFDSTEGNYNVAIAAKSGSGKSVLTQEYIVSIVGSGGRVWVIDIGRSYEKTCRMLGGEFIEFNPEKDISLNPFTFIQNFEESIVMLKPLVAAMARPASRATEEEMTFLEKAIKAAWAEKKNKATITTISNWLTSQDHHICKNLGHLLYSYTKDGMYGRYFEGDCTVNIDNPFVVLELQELKSKKDLQKIVLLVLMYQISEAMYLGNRSQIKSCIIDEAWDLLGGNNDGAAAFIEAGYRTARRYNGNFITITQSINDYFKNATSIAAFENSDHNIILGQKSETIEDVKKSGRLDMDPYTERLFKSLKRTDDYSECVIKSASGISVHRVVLDPYSRILYSSKGSEFEAVKALQARGLSLKDAISEVATRRFNYA